MTSSHDKRGTTELSSSPKVSTASDRVYDRMFAYIAVLTAVLAVYSVTLFYPEAVTSTVIQWVLAAIAIAVFVASVLLIPRGVKATGSQGRNEMVTDTLFLLFFDGLTVYLLIEFLIG